MHNTERCRHMVFFPVVFVVSLLLLTLIFATFRLDDSQLLAKRAATLDAGWQVSAENFSAEMDRVPRMLTAEHGSLTLENQLPEFSCPTSLCFRSNSETVRILVDGREVYRYGMNNSTAFGRYFGTVWNMVELDESASGGRLTIELTSLSRESALDSYKFYLDHHDTILITLLNNIALLALNCLICTAFALLLIISGFLSLRGGLKIARARIYLGLFVLFAQLWVLAGVDVLQFFLGNKAAVHYVVHSSLMLMPVPFALFLGVMFPRCERQYHHLAACFCIYALLRMVLYAANLMEINAGLAVTHLMIIVGVSYALIMGLSLPREGVNLIVLRGLMLFFLFVFSSILLFWIYPYMETDMPVYTMMLSLGVDILMMFFYSAMQKNHIHLESHAVKYAQQAYTDAMTQVNNRAAFNIAVDSLDANEYPRLSLMMIDLNNLKQVNDTLGHPAGDKLICALVSCIEAAFRDLGRIYRYGGDEFVVVIEDAPLDVINEAHIEFDRLVAEHSRHGGNEISVAVGMASRQDPQNTRFSVLDLLHLADMAMYQVKAEQKMAPPVLQQLRDDRLEKIDPATGILSFAAFKSGVYDALTSAKSRFPCIINFDLNFFDGYNNLFGWDAGNRLLQKLADMALALCGEKGFCAHGDADSFWVYADMPDLKTLTNEITEQTRIFQAQLGDCLLFPSFGIYCISERMLPVSDMCSRATSAKKAIKGHLDVLYAVYSTEDHLRRIDNMKLLAFMQKGLEKDEFVPYIQPKYCCRTGRLTGGEALVRWAGTPAHDAAPSDFIQLFEKSGLILSLDWYMLEKTCSLLRRWLDHRMRCVPVSINFSRLHVYEKDCVSHVLELVDRYKLPRSLIEIELTETALVEDSHRIMKLISSLRAEGITVSLDDFGSGLSSLGSLDRLEVDIIKIDRALLEGVGEKDSGSLFEFVVELCRNRNIRTLAEGVENEAQFAVLQRCGCDMVQGNHFSAPIPVHRFEKILQRSQSALAKNERDGKS